MPSDLTLLLKKEDLDVHTVYDEQLAGSCDESILEAAVKEKRALLTFDVDFADIRKYPPGKHCGIVVFRLPDTRWAALKPRVNQILEWLKSSDLYHCLVIVDRRRIRIKTEKIGV